MSDVLIGRIRECLTHYRVVALTWDLTPDELAFEILNAVLPMADEVEWDEPIFWNLAIETCFNCLCADCGCCAGCGGINADCDPTGTHGYWCAL